MIGSPELFLNDVIIGTHEISSKIDALVFVQDIKIYFEAPGIAKDVVEVGDYIDLYYLIYQQKAFFDGINQLSLSLVKSLYGLAGRDAYHLMAFLQEEVGIEMDAAEKIAMQSLVFDASTKIKDAAAQVIVLCQQLPVGKIESLAIGSPGTFGFLKGEINEKLERLSATASDIADQIKEIRVQLDRLVPQVESLIESKAAIDFPKFKGDLFAEYDEGLYFLAESKQGLSGASSVLSIAEQCYRGMPSATENRDYVQEYIEQFSVRISETVARFTSLKDAIVTLATGKHQFFHFLHELTRITPHDFQRLPEPEKTAANSIVSNTGQVLSRVNQAISNSGYQISNLDMELKVITDATGEPVSVSSLKDKDKFSSDQIGSMKFSLVKSAASLAEQGATVPHLIGDTESYAKSKLAQLNIKPFIQYRLTSKVEDAGKVIKQEPVAFETLGPGEVMVLDIGKPVEN